MKSLSLHQPYLLIMVGIPGSGKSLFAQKFSTMFQAPYVNYDTILDIADHNRATAGRYAAHMLQEVFKTRHTVVFDGIADTRAQRTDLKNIATDAGYKPLLIWVQTDPNTAKTRFIKSNRSAGRNVTAAQYDAIIREFNSPASNEQPMVVISGKHTYATQAKAVLKHLTAAKESSRTIKPQDRPASSGTAHNIPVR